MRVEKAGGHERAGTPETAERRDGNKPTLLLRLSTLLLSLFGLLPCLVAQHSNPEVKVLSGSGSLRFVHHGLLANLVKGRFTFSSDGFTFYPSHPRWLMDSLHIPAFAIDSITPVSCALLIHYQGEKQGRLRLQFQHPKKLVSEWHRLPSRSNSLRLHVAQDEVSMNGYCANVRGVTFGSTIRTPISFLAYLTLDANRLTVKPIHAPFSFIHSFHERNEIKRIKKGTNRITVVLQKGGRFVIITTNKDEPFQKKLIDWFDADPASLPTQP